MGKLSEQSAESVNEITQFVTEIQAESQRVMLSLRDSYSESKSGTAGILETSHTFDQISESLQNVVENIREINENVQGLSEAGKEMNQSIAEVASVTEESAASVEETSAASQQINSTIEEVSNQSQLLAKMAEKMMSVVNQFELN